ncbi:MAG: HlyC/CorC family transporter [Corynebacteriales bacterium]|nr:HlyC/CorC family transporter [Mycobacteriales bacterium]
MSDPALLISAGVLVLLAGFCAMCDAAIARVSPTRVAELVRERARGAAALDAVLRALPRHINLLLLLRLAFELTATVLVVYSAVDTWGLSWQAALISAAVMTAVSFALVGVGPRTWGRQHPYPVALLFAPVLRWLTRVLAPIAQLLILVGNALTPGKGYREGPFATELAVRDLVDLAEQRGDVEHDERQMVHSVFDLGDTIVREVMVPRTDVVWIEHTKTVRQGLALALRSGFSRVPVVGEGVDDIVGVVYLKDLARLVQAEPTAATQLVSQVMRSPEFVPESKPVDELLREMQARRIHIAIVIDEYGGTAGLVTIEDIVEEIVGEITDEYDDERPAVQELPGGAVRVTARLGIGDLAELFDVSLPNGDIETVGGLLAQALGKVPIPGAVVHIRGLELTAESAGGRRNRIDTVLVRRLAPEPVSAEPGA